MIVLSKGNTRAPNSGARAAGSWPASPADAGQIPEHAQAVEDRHERPAVDHPLGHPPKRVLRRPSSRGCLAVDRVHDQSRDEVALGPQPRLRKDRGHDRREPDDDRPAEAAGKGPGHDVARNPPGRPRIRVAPTQGRHREPRSRRSRRAAAKHGLSDDLSGVAPRRQSEPVGHRLVEAEDDEHPSQRTSSAAGRLAKAPAVR